MSASPQQLQRDLLTILDRLSMSVDDGRSELGGCVVALIEAHKALGANVMILVERVSTLETVVLQQTKLLQSQAELVTMLLNREYSDG